MVDWNNVFKPNKEQAKQDKTDYTKVNSVEEAVNYLKSAKAKAQKDNYKAMIDESKIVNATSKERIKYINYCISLMPETQKKYKILLTLRANPYMTTETGHEVYLSDKAIADFLTKKVGFKITKEMVAAEEKKGMEYAKDALIACKSDKIPLLGDL